MSNDQLGIQKIYEDSHRNDKAIDWYMGLGNYHDRAPHQKWDSHGNFIGNGNNTIFEWNDDANVRLDVLTGSAYHVSNADADDRRRLVARTDSDGQNRGGYMSRPNDWRDVEMTSYIYLYDIGGNDTVGWYARGGVHSSRERNKHCHGCKYEPYIMYSTGNFGVNKETSHGTGDDNHRRGGNNNVIQMPDGRIGNIVGKWIGYKSIIYNVKANQNYPNTNIPVFNVKMEVWIDDPNENDPDNVNPTNNWKLKMVTEDRPLDPQYGRWGDNGGCGGPNGMTLSWGGPNVTFRADKNGRNDPYDHFRMKYASIREINPGARSP
jgi:hypothetical protein